MQIDADKMNAQSKRKHILDMMQGYGWQILLYEWAMYREKIIQEGKKARADEKKIKNWARLDGFDYATLLPNTLINRFDVEEEEQEEELEEVNA